jgi:hypothetical protein
MIGGNLVLLFLVLLAVRKGEWTLTGLDVAFWLVVVAVPALRYIDITRFGGRQSDGAPAQPGTLKTFALRFVGLWAVLWVLAHSVQLLP